jgi:hypothetical protein
MGDCGPTAEAGYTHYWQWHNRPQTAEVKSTLAEMNRLVQARSELLDVVSDGATLATSSLRALLYLHDKRAARIVPAARIDRGLASRLDAFAAGGFNTGEDAVLAHIAGSNEGNATQHQRHRQDR